MSFLKLLTVGQSLMGLKREQSSYKMAQPNLLPKFSSTAKPAQPLAEPVELFRGARSVRLGAAPVPPSGGKVAQAGATVHLKAKPEPVLSAAVSVGASVKPAGAGLKSWLKKPGFLQRGPTKPARPLVQSELSLDAVRVVRNDLSDADLAVVAKAQAPIVTQMEPVSVVANQPEQPNWANQLVAAVREQF